MSVVAARPRSRGLLLSKVGWSALAWLISIAFFFPVLWMALEGLKTEPQAASIPPTILFVPTLAQFSEVLSRDFPPYLINSAMATFGSTLLVLILGLPAAYALSIRPVKRSRDVLFFLISLRRAWSRSTSWRGTCTSWTTSLPSSSSIRRSIFRWGSGSCAPSCSSCRTSWSKRHGSTGRACGTS